MSQNIQIIIALVALAAVAFTYVLVRKSRSTKSELDEGTRTPLANVDVESSSISQTDKKSEIAAHADQHSEVIEQPVGQAEINEQSQTLEQPSRSVENQPSLQNRLGRSRGSLTSAFRGLFSSTGVSDDAWENLEDTLIMADMGVQATSKVIEHLKAAVKKSNVADENGMLDLAKVELTKIVDAGLDRSLHLARHDEAPAVALTVGVNGTGKTTTTAKLAHLLASKDNDVLLGAADTFRAAAAEQLTTWGDRLGVPVVRGEEGSDPASVAFNAVTAGKEQEVDVVLIDTAGRLHTKQGLMDELGKVHRVVSKQATINEVLLVIDATTGQNGLAQAKVFSEVVPVTGVVLTKLDGTAKGGIVIAVQQELGVPVKLVGLGEGLDDLAPFDPAEFVAGLLA